MINEILWHLFQGIVYLNTQDINYQVVFKIYTFEITTTSPRRQSVSTIHPVFAIHNHIFWTVHLLVTWHLWYELQCSPIIILLSKIFPRKKESTTHLWGLNMGCLCEWCMFHFCQCLVVSKMVLSRPFCIGIRLSIFVITEHLLIQGLFLQNQVLCYAVISSLPYFNDSSICWYPHTYDWLMLLFFINFSLISLVHLLCSAPFVHHMHFFFNCLI